VAVPRAPEADYRPPPPLYRAELAVGRLGEPWLVEVERFPPEPAER
jgi:hypothetical protein